jgi:hypothetical protein
LTKFDQVNLDRRFSQLLSIPECLTFPEVSRKIERSEIKPEQMIKVLSRWQKMDDGKFGLAISSG